MRGNGRLDQGADRNGFGAEEQLTFLGAGDNLEVGDEVVVHPSGLRSTVAGIDLGEQSLDVAVAPQSVTIRLTDDVDVSRGDLLAAATDPVPLRQEVTALACWLGDEPLRPFGGEVDTDGAHGRTVLLIAGSGGGTRSGWRNAQNMM